MCQPSGLGASVVLFTGGYHHWRRMCQPSGLEIAKELPTTKEFSTATSQQQVYPTRLKRPSAGMPNPARVPLNRKH